MIVSREEIEKGKSPRGGWTRATLTAWGVEWPPKKGWKKRLQAGQYEPKQKKEKPPKKEPPRRYETYEKYLRSAHWRNKRQEYWNDPKTRKNCCICGCKECLHLHHKSYKRLYDEPLKHLIPLCEICHSDVHKFHKEGRRGVTLWNADRKLLEARGCPKPTQLREKTGAQERRTKKKRQRAKNHIQRTRKRELGPVEGFPPLAARYRAVSKAFHGLAAIHSPH